MKPLAETSLSIKPMQAVAGPRLEFSERKLLLHGADAFLVLLSLLGALWAWVSMAQLSLNLDFLQDQLYWMIPIFLGWGSWLLLTDTYNLSLAAQVRPIAGRILVGGLGVGLLYLLVFFFTSRTAVSQWLPGAVLDLSAMGQPLRFAPAVAIGISTILLLIWRMGYIVFLCGPQMRVRVLIVGAGLAGRSLYTTIALHYTDHYTVVGFIDDDAGKQGLTFGKVPVLGTHHDLERIAWEQRANEIVLAISQDVPPDLLPILLACHERGLSVTPMPLLYERLTGKVAVQHIGTQWYVALPLQKRPADTALRLIKRLMDIAGALLIGIILVLLLPVLAIAIKLESQGPIFYPQERLGRHGHRFRVYKLRSMYQDAELEGIPQWASPDDPRITRVGNWLRRTRLDEWPQAWNVLIGEMSLVGPRPERPEFVDQLQQAIPFYRTRLAAKPGLTGWAQINFGYGSSMADALTKLQFDLYYLKHQSPWFDLFILARTIAVILRLKGR